MRALVRASTRAPRFAPPVALACALTFVALCALPCAQARADEGSLQPQKPRSLTQLAKLRTADAERLHAVLARERGKPVVLHFWATWCEPCREEIPVLSRFAASDAAGGIAIVAVAVNDHPDKVDEFLWEVDAKLPVLFDREQTIIRALGIRVLPTTLVLDANHRLRLRATGSLDWNSAAVRDALARLDPAGHGRAAAR